MSEIMAVKLLPYSIEAKEHVVESCFKTVTFKNIDRNHQKDFLKNMYRMAGIESPFIIFLETICELDVPFLFRLRSSLFTVTKKMFNLKKNSMY